MMRSPTSASATITSCSFREGMTNVSTGFVACASTSEGCPESWASSPMNEPGPYVTIGWSRPSTLCWLRATSPLTMTNMPGLTSPVATSRSPAR